MKGGYWQQSSPGERAQLCRQDVEVPHPGARPAPAVVYGCALKPSAQGLWRQPHVPLPGRWGGHRPLANLLEIASDDWCVMTQVGHGQGRFCYKRISSCKWALILHRGEVYGLGRERLALWGINGHCWGRNTLHRQSHSGKGEESPGGRLASL